MGMKGFLSVIAGFVFKPAFNAAEKGAKQGNPFEQFNLGLMYYKGRGTAQDYTKAVNWWRRAAEQDFAEALNNLGMMYGNGDGVAQDYVQAHMWTNLAVAQSSGEDRDRRERNRDIIAARVFGDEDSLTRIEQVLHPLVRARERKFLGRCARQGKRQVVLDIPLLFETGGEAIRVRQGRMAVAVRGVLQLLVSRIGYDNIIDRLIEEIWRLFLIAVILALLAEAVLSLGDTAGAKS